MKLKIKKLKFMTGRSISVIHEKTAEELGFHIGDRISIENKNKKIISVIDIISKMIKLNEIAVSEKIIRFLRIKDGDNVEIKIIEKPYCIDLIKKKLDGHRLNKNEIKEIIENIANNSLTEIEIAFFISAVHSGGMSLNETKYLTEAMVETGNILKLKGKIADKHSIGGIAGNKTTPILVSICAATGLIIPKTSSRAITSAAGTADVIETITRVDFSIKEIKKIIKKTNACFVWGGALGLAPVDDEIIRIERLINIDSTSQLLASILSKKISVGSKYILIDIPYGKSAKVTKKQAEKLKGLFLDLADKFKINLEVALTDGSEPIGNGIGPVLEMNDVIKVLSRKNPPKDLEEKSIFLSGKLLELSRKVKSGEGEKLAMEILNSKKALKKFNQIVQAQSGNKNKIKKFKKPKFSYEINAEKNIKVDHISNNLINRLARYLGCPEDKSAGIYLHKKKGGEAKKGEKIMTIYADSKEKLKHGINFYKKEMGNIIEFS